MSDSLMAFQPAMDEPSNIVPSFRKSSSTRSMSKVTCCSLPRVSVKRTSTYLTSFSLISLRILLALILGSPVSWSLGRNRSISAWTRRPPEEGYANSDGLGPGLAGADTDHLGDVGHENLAVAYLAGAGRGLNGLDDRRGEIVGDDHLDIDLGQEVDDVFGAAIQLRMTLLAAISLGLQHSHALHADVLERLFDVIQLERLDDGFNLLHGDP